MSAPTVIACLGQAAAGDDGAGPAVYEALRQRALPDDVELRRAAEPTALIELFADRQRLILVDAVLAGDPVGAVLQLDEQQLARRGAATVSSHGVGLASALALARTLYPDSPTAVEIIAISIERPRDEVIGLSAAVAAGVVSATEQILATLTGD